MRRFSFTAPANAGYTLNATVTKILVMQNGSVLFYLSAPDLSPPTCATQSTRWAFDATTPAGQAKLAFLLSAKATNASIQVSGLNTCSVWGDTETVDYFGNL